MLRRLGILPIMFLTIYLFLFIAVFTYFLSSFTLLYLSLFNIAWRVFSICKNLITKFSFSLLWQSKRTLKHCMFFFLPKWFMRKPDEKAKKSRFLSQFWQQAGKVWSNKAASFFVFTLIIQKLTPLEKKHQSEAFTEGRNKTTVLKPVRG